MKIPNAKWYWWSQGIGGYTALDYLIKVRKYGFVEAVEILTGQAFADWKPPPVAEKKTSRKCCSCRRKTGTVTEWYSIFSGVALIICSSVFVFFLCIQRGTVRSVPGPYQGRTSRLLFLSG